LIIISPDKREALERELAVCEIKASCIGTVKEPAYGIKIMHNGNVSEITPPDSDELYKAKVMLCSMH